LIALLFFIIISIVISYIDIKKGLILDTIILPSFAVLVLIKYLDSSLVMEDLLSVALLLFIFVVPIALKMAFGGGDLRFGAFCALFVGLESLGYFVLLSGLFHLILLILLKKESFPFAPAMSVGAFGAFILGNI
jgi:prepilin signal peptidase PulO-like enzyme (type II secretory pathway)